MLDAFIIEELRRREEASRSVGEQPYVELPIDEQREPAASRVPRPLPPAGRERGAVIIEY